MRDTCSVPPWNLVLRFVLELAAAAGIAVGVEATGGWILGAVAAVVGFVIWGTFATPDDPSRSGKAPVPVGGPLRLLVELGFFAAGVVGWLAAGWEWVAAPLVVALAVHHVFSIERLRWLLAQRRP